MSRFISFLFACLFLAGCVHTAAVSSPARFETQADYVVIEKSGRSLTLWSEGRILKSYPILSLGSNPTGHKQREGDGRTPEGRYYINEKHISHSFQKFLNISYPDRNDIAAARARGDNPGGNVGIHGDKGGLSGFLDRMNPQWTQGCITVRNAALEEIYALVPVGTPVWIKP